MTNKAVRVALEAVAVVLLAHFGQVIGGVLGNVLLALALIVLIYAIVDLFRR